MKAENLNTKDIYTIDWLKYRFLYFRVEGKIPFFQLLNEDGSDNTKGDTEGVRVIFNQLPFLVKII